MFSCTVFCWVIRPVLDMLLLGFVYADNRYDVYTVVGRILL